VGYALALIGGVFIGLCIAAVMSWLAMRAPG
jgi:hypothetical protein